MIIKSIDIFCEVIDNYGDIGFTYRLARELRREYDKNVVIRVFLNRLDEFKKINRKIKDVEYQELDGIYYMTNDFLEKNNFTIQTSDVIIASYGCCINKKYAEKAKKESSLLINLEYLSGEKWIEEVHLMESPIGSEKLKKYFFMPGFNEKTGGIILDKSFLERKKNILENKKKYLEKYFSNSGEKEYFIGTIFSYEKNFLPLITELEKNKKDNILFILGEKSQWSIKKMLDNFEITEENDNLKYKNILFKFIEFLNQEEYEELINISDYNFVRGEDSLVIGILTGKPFVWHVYRQEEMTHIDKIKGFTSGYRNILKNRDDIALENHIKLLEDYNFRYSNTLDIGSENFENFFKDFERIKKLTEEYSEYLENNCNLIAKLNNFIVKYREE